MVTILEDFESGTLNSAYKGDTGRFGIQQSTVYEGGDSLEESGSTDTHVAITRTDKTISPGETPVNCWVQDDGGGNMRPGFVWGVQSAVGYSNLDAYAVELDASGGYFYLSRIDNGSHTILSYTSITASVGEFYNLRITEWTDSGSITATLYDQSSNQVTSLSATDDTYGTGGFGWLVWNNYAYPDTESHYFDYATKPTPLSPPANVQITDASTEDELTVGWDDNSSAGYYVYRAQATGSTKSDYTQVADVTSPPYTDTNLEDGEKYFYRVSSHD